MAKQFIFGAGNLYAIPKTDAAGAAVANPTPVKIGTLQDVSMDVSFEEKLLHGEFQYPVAAARGKGKISLKAKTGEINGRLLGLILGVAPTTQRRSTVNNTPASIPASPYQITVTPPNTGTFVEDLGVFFAATGVQLVRVASTPATGQYSVNGSGQYTFAAADTTLGVLISYGYTNATAGETYAAANALMGAAPEMSITSNNVYEGKSLNWQFPRVQCNKLAMSLKNDDFAVPDLDFTCYADAAGYAAYVSQG